VTAVEESPATARVGGKVGWGVLSRISPFRYRLVEEELLGSKSLHSTLVDSQQIRPTGVSKFRENSCARLLNQRMVHC
jgi:hypothetical protein